MGSNASDAGSDEKPSHLVTVSTFSISQTETTVLQWKTYCSETGCQLHNPVIGKWNDSLPIHGINWDKAVAYCQWLSAKTGKKYRLPTEAEWEYAAKGGATGLEDRLLYSGSNNPDEVGWTEENSDWLIHPIGLKKPNQLGLYDMSGNVWEWCSDFYSDTYYSKKPANNPTGPKKGNFHVLRGGSWDYPASFSRMSERESNAPWYSHFYGFRVVMETD